MAWRKGGSEVAWLMRHAANTCFREAAGSPSLSYVLPIADEKQTPVDSRPVKASKESSDTESMTLLFLLLVTNPVAAGDTQLNIPTCGRYGLVAYMTCRP